MQYLIERIGQRKNLMVEENSQKTRYDKVFSRQNFSTRRAIK